MAQTPTRSDATAPIPATITVDSPEFRAAVADAVAAALAASSLPARNLVEPTVVGVPQPVVIQPTSIDTSQPGPDDLTVRFTRFCTFQNRGYQRSQEAGFPRKAAEDLHKSGSAFIVWDPRVHDRQYARLAA